MALTGELAVDVDVKSSADKFWGGIRNSSEVFVKAFPNRYKGCTVLEGDGKSVGTVMMFDIVEDVPHLTSMKEKIVSADEEKKVLVYEYIGGEFTNLFKAFKGTIVLVPKSDGCTVKWNAVYEKVSDEAVPDPSLYATIAKHTFLDLDEYLLKN